MGNALKEQGKLEEAIESIKEALSIKPNYGSAKHMLSALTGNTKETAPREYVENLFDGYSKKFEASLVDKLEYKIPKLIRDILIKQNSNDTLGSVLDLGCGTGLLGPEIKHHCLRLEGIDLSNKMLTIAKQKNVYDKLIHSDIVEYLSSMSLDFDYYIALDVFIYVGDLSEIFRLIKSRNKKPGKLVFSTEHTKTDGFHLLKSGRYSHSKSYIEGFCRKFGYNISHFSTTDLRKEKGHFLTGGIYTLSF
jgi:predicted TPR repeat methyltransferase